MLRVWGFAVVECLALATLAWAGQMLPAGVSEDTLSAEPAFVRLVPQPIAFVPLKTVRNTPESRELISGTFKRIGAYLKQKKIAWVGSPMEIMDAYQEADGSWAVSAAIPIATAPAETLADAGDIAFGALGGGDAAQAGHRGDHWRIKETHDRIAAFIAANGRSAKGKIVEQHFDNPHTTPVEKLRSAVTYFLE